MDILGAIGNLYTFILLVILFLGSGLAVWAGINSILKKKDELKENTSRIKGNLNSRLQNLNKNNIIGGFSMKNSGFIKLAVFSFIGIIISAAILTALPKYSGTMSNTNMSSQYNNTSMNMSGNGMNSQYGMQGMANYSFQGTMSNNSDLYYIQQQLNNMQQQINQMQSQINSGNSMNNNSSSNSNNSSSSSMSNMPMM